MEEAIVRRTVVMAEGVKGLLRTRSESLVVCARRSVLAVVSRARAFGEVGFNVSGAWTAGVRLLMRALVEAIAVWRLASASEVWGEAIVEWCVLFWSSLLAMEILSDISSQALR
jgi:hypothetical protein